MNNSNKFQKHTPGPWSADAFGVVTGGQSLCTSIAETYLCKWLENSQHVEPQIEEARANARLIAAAPELLDAAELCKAFINHGPSSTRSASRCIEALNSALSKARGES